MLSIMVQKQQGKVKKKEYAQLLCDFMFKRLFLLAEIGNFNPDEMAQYLESLGNMSDYYNIIDSAAELAEKRGHEAELAEGIVIGREEGREEAKIEDARKLMELGVALEIISAATGISIESLQIL